MVGYLFVRRQCHGWAHFALGAAKINGFRKEASVFFDISIFEGRKKFPVCRLPFLCAVCYNGGKAVHYGNLLESGKCADEKARQLEDLC